MTARAPEFNGQTVALIAALDRHRAIGRGNAMPWHLPSDLQFFRRVTSGKALLMGRKTFESIGRPLPDRRNIVITSQRDYRADGCELAASLDHALALAGPGEVMIGGGATLYRQTLPRAGRLYLTFVDAEVSGDAFFPAVDYAAWTPLWWQYQPADARHQYRYRRALYLLR